MRILRPGLCLLLLLCALLGHADSLWNDTSRSLYSDPKARVVGDLLTVYINTNATVSSQAQHVTSKNQSVSATAGTGLMRFFPAMGMKAGRDTNGSGSTSSSTQLLDQVTVIVKEVLPNGNLRVEGERTVKIEKDVSIVTFSGIVRPQDIAPDNTILSSAVAEQTLVTKGTGPIAEKQRPGWLNRFLSWLW